MYNIYIDVGFNFYGRFTLHRENLDPGLAVEAENYYRAIFRFHVGVLMQSVKMTEEFINTLPHLKTLSMGSGSFRLQVLMKAPSLDLTARKLVYEADIINGRDFFKEEKKDPSIHGIIVFTHQIAGAYCLWRHQMEKLGWFEHEIHPLFPDTDQ